MSEALKNVTSGSVTYAIKDTDIEGVHITKGYYMAMKEDKTIVSCVKEKDQALLDLLKSLSEIPDKTMFTVLLGNDVTAEEEAHFQEELPKLFPDFEFLIRHGDQGVYSFLVGLE